MLIRLRVQGRRPPQGEVGVRGRAPVPFDGWLDLLRVLSEAIEEPEDKERPDGG
jgi:hypothetical protein